MNIVWLSRFDPRQSKGGGGIYSYGLLNGLCNEGANIHMITYAKPWGEEITTPQPEALTVTTLPTPMKWRGWSLFSTLHSDAFQLQSAFAAEVISKALDSHVDVLVFDYFSTAWALPVVLFRIGQRSSKRPLLIYISHNHEASVRRSVAATVQCSPLIKAAMYVDSLKAQRTENRLVRSVDLITSITDEDKAKFSQDAPKKIHLTLLPGIDASAFGLANISSTTPRRVVMMGTTTWVAKQEGLRSFVDAAETRFSDAGIELVIIGRSDVKFMGKLCAKSKIVNYLGVVEDPTTWLHSSRVGLMPDTSGGGFKIKYLHYIFSGLPVATIRSQAVGLPLNPNTAMIVGDTPDQLVDGIIQNIDNLERLNAMRDAALACCQGRFEWRDRAKELQHAMCNGIKRLSVNKSPP